MERKFKLSFQKTQPSAEQMKFKLAAMTSSTVPTYQLKDTLSLIP